MSRYRTFIRNWYRREGGRIVPGPGRKTHHRDGLTIDQARAECADYNSTHKPGPLSRKMEFESY